MHVVVASKNPTKLAGVTDAFQRVFFNASIDEALTVTGVRVDSGVGEQPVGDEQTMQGALQRAEAARVAQPEADYWVGVEGGVVWHPAPVTGAGLSPESGTGTEQAELECMAWVAVLGADGRVGKARSNGFLLPPAMAALIASGVKQDLADNQVLGRADSGTTNGTVGYLSHNLITRTHYTADTVILALAPFVHPEHYPVAAVEAVEAMR